MERRPPRGIASETQRVSAGAASALLILARVISNVYHNGNAMKRTWTIIGVSDVRNSCKWYQSLFGQPRAPPGHDYFGQILDSGGTVLLCLHQWGAHGHPSLMSPGEASPGNGLLLFFRVDDFGPVLQRARALVARFDEEPHVNPNTQTREFSLRDQEGYYVTISALSAPQRRRPARRRLKSA